MTDYKKEIVFMLKEINSIPHLKFIYGTTRSAYKEEQAAKRIKDMEQRGECDE
jgi:hypothetical protein